MVGLVVLEKRRPLRRKSQPEPRRTVGNLLLGGLSIGVASALQKPLVEPVARAVGQRRIGLVQGLPLSSAAKDLLAIAGMDYTIYLWHVATHRVPFLWRFHLVHHIDRDLDASTALRFHVAEMVLSVPYRALQIVLIGTSGRALAVWQRFFFLSVLFHHSNLRLPQGFERVLALFLTSPRMHGIHHSTVVDEQNSNWSSGLSIWDRLHGTFRLDVPQEQINLGVAGYGRPEELEVGGALALPFRQRTR